MIKPIIPQDNDRPNDFTKVPKMVQVVTDKVSGTIEWQPQNAQLTEKEARFIADVRGIKGNPPVTRYKDIKTAILEGLSLEQIRRRYRGQKGFNISEIKAVSAALSDYNGWKR